MLFSFLSFFAFFSFCSLTLRCKSVMTIYYRLIHQILVKLVAYPYCQTEEKPMEKKKNKKIGSFCHVTAIFFWDRIHASHVYNICKIFIVVHFYRMRKNITIIMNVSRHYWNVFMYFGLRHTDIFYIKWPIYMK